jgi:hypothetical protein
MKHIRTILAASVLGLSAGAQANPMYIDLGTNDYDTGRFIGTPDADTRTANFTEFGFSQILATSFYNFNDGSVFGSFFDTNDPVILGNYGIPTSGTALDGVTNVSLVLPDCPNGQCDIDALSPLVPPLGTNNEGFLQTWDLQVSYVFNGNLGAGGPVYTSGQIDVYFNDLTALNNDRLIMTGTLTGSDVNLTNLDLFFDITFVEDNWLFIDNGSGVFVDAADGIPSGNYARLALDTNVNPPIPTANQLLLVSSGDGNVWAARQTTLDGSVTGQIPAPGVLALFGVGLLAGVGALRRRAG